MISRVYLDVDGVLVDWHSGAVQAVGGAYRIPTALDRPVMLRELLPPGVSKTQMWRRINELGEAFWRQLPVYPWAPTLIDVCRQVAPMTILTKPSFHPSSVKGKVEWLHEMFGESFTDYVLTHDKAAACGRPGALLIDDHEENIEAWAATGGHAILFPHAANKRYREAHDPLRAILDEIWDIQGPQNP